MAADLKTLFDLSGNTAVITGAGGSICGRIAEDLAGNGVRVALIDVNQGKVEERAAAIRRLGGTVQAYTCSVTDPVSLKKVYKDIEKKWSLPDFLINGAGGNSPEGTTTNEFMESNDVYNDEVQTIFNMDPEDFKCVMDLNFNGTLYPSQIFGKGMALKGSGSIINISSLSGILPLTKVAAYSSAKAAVINFTRWLAVNLAHTGVRVNTIAPGFIATEQSYFLQYDRYTGKLNSRGKSIINKTPMGRFGKPEEIFGTVAWLLSAASGFVTGIVVPVDGGFFSYSI